MKQYVLPIAVTALLATTGCDTASKYFDSPVSNTVTQESDRLDGQLQGTVEDRVNHLCGQIDRNDLEAYSLREQLGDQSNERAKELYEQQIQLYDQLSQQIGNPLELSLPEQTMSCISDTINNVILAHVFLGNWNAFANTPNTAEAKRHYEKAQELLISYIGVSDFNIDPEWRHVIGEKLDYINRGLPPPPTMLARSHRN